MKVNPYTINLGKTANAMELDTTSDEAIAPGTSILKDVDVMWFYPKPEMETA
jgi:hypothetical protein